MHVEDNFIVNHDVHKGELFYVCLSEECSPQRTLITKLNGTNAVEEDFSKKLGVKSDLEAAQRVMELYPYWVCCEEVLYVFDDKTGMWCDKQNVFFSVLSDLEDDLHLITWDEKKFEWKRHTKGYGNDSFLIKKMLLFIQSICIDNSWMKNNAISSLGKLLFNNGYLNLKTGIFYNDFDPDIVFFSRIPIKYKQLNDEGVTYMMDVKNRMFDVPLGNEFSDFFLLQLSHTLAGDLMKRIMFGLGPSDCGKSTLVEACQSSFGEYVGSFNAETLSCRESKTDEAAVMRWCLLLQYKRIIFSNEIKTTADLEANVNKKISRGCDRITGRLHSGNETPFNPHFLACVMANDLPRINPYCDAVDKRVRVINYEKVFVDNPSNQFEAKKDVNLSDEMKTQDFQRVFLMLLIKTYRDFLENGAVEYDPPGVIAAKEN